MKAALPLLYPMLFAVVFACPLRAWGDSAAPVLQSLTFTPTTGDITTAPLTISVTAHFTDNLTGVTSAFVRFDPPGGAGGQSVQINVNRISGTAQDGTYEGTAQIPRYAPTGTWRIGAIVALDAAGNSVNYSRPGGRAPSYPAAIDVPLAITGSGDATAPVLQSLTYTPTSGDVALGPVEINVTGHFTDYLAGVTSAFVRFDPPGGAGGQSVQINVNRISGTAQDGTYEGTAQIPRYAPTGTWRIGAIVALDAAGNSVNYSRPGGPSPNYPAPIDVPLIITSGPPVPEIVVEQPLGTDLTDRGAARGFGTVNLGSSALLTFTIRNSGTGSMSGLAITKNGTNATDFTVSALGVATLAAGASRTFTVTFNPAAAGARTAAIQIASNDADENPFDINLTGTGRAVPEIVVQQPAGTGLTDGSAVPVDFGKVTTGTSGSRTFTIRNTGTADLTGIVVTLNGGTAAGDFSIWDLGATTLTPETATTFQVFFLPGGPGARTATLMIASNDEDENPFEIALTGTRATPQLDAWRQTYFSSTANSGAAADLSDPDRDGVVNLMEFATDTGPWTANGQPGELVKNGSSLEFTWRRRKAALAEISYAVEWSESLTEPWSAAGVSTVVFTDGPVMQVMKSTLPAGGSGSRFVRLRVARL